MRQQLRIGVMIAGMLTGGVVWGEPEAAPAVLGKTAALDAVLASGEKAAANPDPAKQMDKAQKDDFCKKLCAMLDAARAELNAAEAQQKALKTPPKNDTSNDAMGQENATKFANQGPVLESTKTKLTDIQARLDALCGRDCCKKKPSAAKTVGAGITGKEPTVVDTVPIEEIQKKK